MSKEDIAALQTVGGLISHINKSLLHESSVTRSISLGLVATNDSQVKLQWLTLARAAKVLRMAAQVLSLS